MPGYFIYKEVEVRKKQLIIEEIGFKYMPELFGDIELIRGNYTLQQCYDETRIVELAIEKVAGIKFIDEIEDFDDESDAKTCGINDRTTSQIHISNVWKKRGSLRVVCYNYIKDSLDYFFIPHKRKLQEEEYTKDWIRFRYNQKKDYYTKFDPVKTFEDICCKTS